VCVVGAVAPGNHGELLAGYAGINGQKMRLRATHNNMNRKNDTD
jgi:hypothetical protein